MTLFEIINQIEADKRKRKVYPEFALLKQIYDKASEIYPISYKEIIDAEIEEASKQNKINIGRTINDKYIIITDGTTS